MTARRPVVLGGGVTGLAAGGAGGATVYEASDGPGGICASYYLTPDGDRSARPPDAEAYRFEVGGGHWIFGGDPSTVAWIEARTPLRSYVRRASVRLEAPSGRVEYPIQHHLGQLGPELAGRALAEISAGPSDADDVSTMAGWLRANFGPTLCELFFDPFHERYTAGLVGSIAPQDPDKSPVHLDAVVAGARGDRPGGGYNQRFAYPIDGLDALVRAMAGAADVRFGRRACAIDTTDREVHFDDGSSVGYDHLRSTLPLDVAVALAGIVVEAPPDPRTSVLVVNIGAEPGPRLGTDHWVYDPFARSGFHRYGIYSNVDGSFLPAGARSTGAQAPSRAALYVERAYPGGDRPPPDVESDHVDAMVAELQDREVIGRVDVVDPTWIDAAYTWTRPGSGWVGEALTALERAGVHQVGRYGRWQFQGIADSIAQGLAAGRADLAGAGDR